MDKYFLIRIKHYQILFLILIIPAISYILESMDFEIIVLEKISTYFLLLIFVWYYSIASFLKKLKIFIIRIELFRIILLIFFLVTFVVNFITLDLNVKEFLDLIVVLLHITIIIILTSFLKIRKNSINISFNPLLSFLSLLFFPIGFFYIQPRLNKLYEYYLNNKDENG